MKKGELTRRNIIQKSATIFNIKGYMTTTMNDIIEETNIKKGGIYRHFENKEQLMSEAFQFSVEIMQTYLYTSVSQHRHAADKLFAFVDAFLELSEGKPMIGGCPIFNAAIEMDDLEGNMLLPSIHEAMDLLLKGVMKIVEDGILHQELKQSINPYDIAIYIISTLEGGIVLARLKKDEQVIKSIVNNLRGYISTITTERQ